MFNNTGNFWESMQNKTPYAVHEVGSFEDAKTRPTDPSKMNIFLDARNGLIYCKMRNSQGVDIITTYQQVANPLTQAEILEIKLKHLETIDEKIKNLEKIITELGGAQNVSTVYTKSTAKPSKKE